MDHQRGAGGQGGSMPAQPSLQQQLQLLQQLSASGVQPGGPGFGPSPARGGRPSGTPRKLCNCKNSRCLKLYCECFASGRYCDSCNCVNCLNNHEHEGTRQAAVESILERNPNAFRPKIQGNDAEVASVRAALDGAARHTKGCNCKKSTCLKKYCECFQAGISCSDICKCVDCKNYDGSEARGDVLAVQEIGMAPYGMGVMASPSKRARGGGAGFPGQQQLGSGAGAARESAAQYALMAGGGGGMGMLGGGGGAGGLWGACPGMHAGFQGGGDGEGYDMGRAAGDARARGQALVAELVPPEAVDELCQALFEAAAAATAGGDAAGGDARAAAAGAATANGGGDGNGNGDAPGGAGHSSANGGRGAEAAAEGRAAARTPGPPSPSERYEAQEAAVLAELGSMLGRIAEAATRRTAEDEAAAAQLQLSTAHAQQAGADAAAAASAAAAAAAAQAHAHAHAGPPPALGGITAAGLSGLLQAAGLGGGSGGSAGAGASPALMAAAAAAVMKAIAAGRAGAGGATGGGDGAGGSPAGAVQAAGAAAAPPGAAQAQQALLAQLTAALATQRQAQGVAPSPLLGAAAPDAGEGPQE